jgi:5'-3' exonuclease
MGNSHPPSVLYDANNWLRRRFESGTSIRVCLAEVKVRPGVVVFDGPFALKRRRNLYSNYKVSRNPLANDMAKNFELFQRLLTCVNVPTIRVPGWEADDVIASIIRHCNELAHVNSTDADFLQLPNVTIEQRKPFPVPSEFIRTYKSSVGDKSDKIPGMKGFGEKAWGNLTQGDKEMLRAFLAGEIGGYPANIPKGTQAWLEDHDNVQLVRTFYDITQLYTVPWDEIMKHTVVGQNDPAGAEIIFKEFLL